MFFESYHRLGEDPSLLVRFAIVIRRLTQPFSDILPNLNLDSLVEAVILLALGVSIGVIATIELSVVALGISTLWAGDIWWRRIVLMVAVRRRSACRCRLLSLSRLGDISSRLRSFGSLLQLLIHICNLRIGSVGVSKSADLSQPVLERFGSAVYTSISAKLWNKTA